MTPSHLRNAITSDQEIEEFAALIGKHMPHVCQFTDGEAAFVKRCYRWSVIIVSTAVMIFGATVAQLIAAYIRMRYS